MHGHLSPKRDRPGADRTANPAVVDRHLVVGSHLGLPISLASFLSAVDPWLSLFPREPGRRLTEIFLRSVLIGYMTVVLLIPLLLAGSLWFLIRARRQGRLRRGLPGSLCCAAHATRHRDTRA